MLEYMKQSIETVFKYKDEVDKDFRDTIILAMCSDILNKYILLIPNERNHRDAKIISNIDETKVYNEAVPIDFEFSLFEVLRDSNSVEGAIQFIKDRSIIVKQDEKVIKEFFQTMKVGDELVGREGARYLTRRHLMHKGQERYTLDDRIDEYWSETTSDDLNLIEINCGKDIEVMFQRTLEAVFPERANHDKALLNREEFFNESKYELKKELEIENRDFFKGLISQVENAAFVFKREDALKYFGIIKAVPFIDNRTTLVSSEQNKKNRIIWTIKVRMSPRDFVDRLVKEFL